jgi:hypothetical protein
VSEDDRDWFAPKRFGYGAGLPISWQGWALLLGYLALLGLAGFLLPVTIIGYASVVTMLTAVFIVIVARTTRGGWRWRWGEKDQ